MCSGPRLSQICCSRATSSHRGEPVVQRLEPDPSLGGLAFGPLVAVDAQLGGVGEVGAELEEERAEVAVHAVEVEEVDER